MAGVKMILFVAAIIAVAIAEAGKVVGTSGGPNDWFQVSHAGVQGPFMKNGWFSSKPLEMYYGDY